MSELHDRFMRLALEQARMAEAQGEVPIGAVVVLDGEVIGRGFNRPIGAIDPTAHAEILALRAAAQAVGNYRLVGADVYVTVEPCLMCVGALVLARVRTVIFGAREPKTGALISTAQPLEIPSLNHRFEVVEGVLEDDCREFMQAFFRARRLAGPAAGA
jgi:tRNA(adenine34) deaminase